ncbi:MAG: type II secretion system minor pseudopilin GspI [Thiohalobacteraceae bacterium]
MIRAQRPDRVRGFTLLEVLVALAVLALALAAAIRASGAYAGNQAYLQERTLAHWVARNALTELQLETQWPGTGERSDSARMADLDWEWRATISDTPDEDLRRVEIDVWLGEKPEGQPLAGLTGFLERR